MMKEDKYKQIADLAEWVNTNRVEIAKDGMNVIIAIGDSEKMWRLCLTGNAFQLAIMMKILKDGGDAEWHKIMDSMA